MPAPDGAAGSRHAFGLVFDARDGLGATALLGGGPGDGRRPATVLSRATPAELAGEWPAAEATRTREVRAADGALGFAVEHAPAAGYRVHMPAHGDFLVDPSGATVRCVAADEQDWATGLLTQALPLAATLRGLELLHASAVVLDGRAVLLAGRVMAGKSTLAAHLVVQGGTLLTDDVLAVEPTDHGVRAHPGGRMLHLRAPQDAQLEAIGSPRAVPSGRAGGRARIAVPCAPTSAPLAAVYLLSRSGPDGASPIRPHALSGIDLLAATYNLSVRTPERLARQLDVCHRIATTVPGFTLELRPGSDPAALAAAVREHVASAAATAAATAS